MSETVDRLTAALSGRYRIERELGQGGMATVYLAEDIKHERKVALKILKPELAAVIGAERFLSEIKTTANLQHPHILALFDSGEADGFLYYVMPFIDGETLRDKLDREKQLGVDEAVRIATSVADALDYAHRQGVIHRDIKPANILLHDGRPIVADFGIAVAISAAGGGRMTETGLSLGTPHYMSPEQASADRDLSARSDVYSLGCVLYEMLAGQPPHTGPSAQSILVRILTEDPRSVSDLRRTVPPNVAATVMKAIEKLPADRFDSARQFIDGLEDAAFSYHAPTRALGTPGVSALPPAPGASKASRLLVRGLAGAVGVFAALAAWGWLRPAPTGPVAPATLARIDLEGLPVDATSKVTISPDGLHLAVVSGEGGSSRALWVRNIDEEVFRPLLEGQDVRFPSFSPGGDWIVYEDDRALMKVALSGGAPRVVVPESAGLSPLQPHWGDDGNVVFESTGTIYRVSETGGTATALLDARTSAANVRLLPGGRGITFSDREEFTSYYMDLASDTAVAIIPGGVAPQYVETGHLLYVDEDGGLWALPFDPRAGRATGQAVPILQNIALRFSWMARFDVSLNGTLVYGTGGTGVGGSAPTSELLVVDLNGNEQRLPLSPRVIERPRWAPDGERIAYAGTEAGRSADPTMIYEYNVAQGTPPRRLTSEGTLNTSPVWSPDGTRIAFNSLRQGSSSRELFVKNVFDDGPPVSILYNGTGRATPSHWLDGDTLVYTFGTGPNENHTWTMLVSDSTTAAPYLEGDGNRTWARVAPQRDLTAFESTETGRSEIFVRSFPVPRQPTPVSTTGGTRAIWSPDGNTIYYWKETPGEDSLFAARIQRRPAFAVLTTDFVLAGDYSGADNWDLHPDGNRFITTRFVVAGPDQSGALNVEPERHLIVTNWFTELLAAVGEER